MFVMIINKKNFREIQRLNYTLHVAYMVIARQPLLFRCQIVIIIQL